MGAISENTVIQASNEKRGSLRWKENLKIQNLLDILVANIVAEYVTTAQKHPEIFKNEMASLPKMGHTKENAK